MYLNDLNTWPGSFFSTDQLQVQTHQCVWASPSGWEWNEWPSPPRHCSRCPPSRRVVDRCTPRRKDAERSAAETGHYLSWSCTSRQIRHRLCVPRAWRHPSNADVTSSHLSQCGFAFEEVRVLAALWWVKFRVEESTAIGDGLQRGWTLIGEGETHKQLQRGKTCKWIKQNMNFQNVLSCILS